MMQEGHRFVSNKDNAVVMTWEQPFPNAPLVHWASIAAQCMRDSPSSIGTTHTNRRNRQDVSHWLSA